MTLSIVARSLAVALAIPVVASLCPSDVKAADSKSYPGSVCRGSSGTSTIQVSGGWAANVGGSFDTAHCPLVRDATSIASAVISVHDQSASNISCTLIAESESGSSVTQDTENQNSSGNSATYQNLSFGSFATHSYYYATCAVPGVNGVSASDISSISLNEN